MIATSIDFVFLRPAWLLALLPILLLPLWQRRYFHSSGWHRYLPAAVIERLLQGPMATQRITRRWWPIQLILMLTVVALAGPSFVKQAVPAVQKKDAVVIVLDLSLSMYAEDQAPNRLARAKQKIHDLLALREDGLTGLVVFAGSAHVVAPLTDDRETLRAMLPALDPTIMPESGANPGLALIEAGNLITQAGLENGRILLLTDSIEASNLDALLSLRASLPSGIAVSVLAFGTSAGGPISLPDQGFLKRGGEVIIARSDLDAAMNLAAARSSDLAAEVRFDDSDLRKLVPELSSNSVAALAESDQTIEQRIDQGYWLVPIIATLGLWLFRQGVLLAALGPALIVLGSLSLAPAMLLVMSPQAHAAPSIRDEAVNQPAAEPNLPSFWDRLWQRDDQLAERAYRQQDYPTAAALFEDLSHRGAAQYQAGDFAAAVETLEQAPPDAENRFNLGNAWAYAGELEAAIAAYTAALELDPDMTAAEENRSMIQELLKQQTQQQDQSPQQKQDQQDQQNKSDGDKNPESDENSDEQQGGDDASGDGQPSDQTPGEDSKQNQSQGADSQAGSDKAATEEDQASTGEKADDKGDEEQTGTATGEQSAESGEQRAQSSAGSGDTQSFDLSEQQQTQWLRRIPDDPGELLRRKFLYQYRNPDSRYDQRTPGSDQRNGSKPDRSSPGTASSHPW